MPPDFPIRESKDYRMHLCMRPSLTEEWAPLAYSCHPACIEMTKWSGVAGWTLFAFSVRSNFRHRPPPVRDRPRFRLLCAPAKRSAARSAPHHRNNELGQGRSRAADVTVTQVRRILCGKLILVLQAGQPILGIGRHSRIGPPTLNILRMPRQTVFRLMRNN